MEVLIIGAEVGSPVVLRLVTTTPVVWGIWVLRLGRIWAVPEDAEVVTTGTLADTDEVETGSKKMPPSDGEVEVSGAWSLVAETTWLVMGIGSSGYGTNTSPLCVSCTTVVTTTTPAVVLSPASTVGSGAIVEVASGAMTTLLSLGKVGSIQSCGLGKALAVAICNTVSHTNAFMVVVSGGYFRRANATLEQRGSNRPNRPGSSWKQSQKCKRLRDWG